jgi:chemotaxis protein MotB
MRKRRYVPDSDENHDRWLISYADLVTLLFAFFVVMYAISQVNEGKYRVVRVSQRSGYRAGRHGLHRPCRSAVELADPASADQAEKR